MLPCQWESGPGEARRKFGSPRALSTCFLAVGEASALSRLLRGRKGWVQDFPSFRCQPLQALPGLACSLVPDSVCPKFICLWHVLALVWLCFRYLSCRPWMNPNHPSPDSDPDFLPSFRPCWPNIFSSPCPGWLGLSGLMFNTYFHLTQQMWSEGLGRIFWGLLPPGGF